MAQLAIGIACCLLAVLGLCILFNLYKRWPTMLYRYEVLLAEDTSEETRSKYQKLKSSYAQIRPVKPFLWIGVIGLSCQGIYSLVVGLSVLLQR